MFQENLFLTNETGKHLYKQYAKDMPIIDYHCHLQPKEIYENKVFEDIGQMWLAGDHYKWRAMRTFGIDEKYITGDASFYEKYLAFAKIFPQLIGNPLYIWCALELKRFFNISEPLCEENAEDIYQRTKKLIEEKQMTPRYCMEVSNVKMVCTTEDPTDTLEFHVQMQKDPSLTVKVLSAFRPDKAFNCQAPGYTDYIAQLSTAADMPITSFESLMAALEKRLEFFKSIGCMVSDSGIQKLAWEDYTADQIEAAFTKALSGKSLSDEETYRFQSAFMMRMAKLYHKHGFVMQMHIGTYRNANTAMVQKLGPDTGFDCTDDANDVRSLGRILDLLSGDGTLPKTILYPLNPSQAEPYAILAAAFCGDGIRGKVQLGAPWWFSDQVYGIERQFEAVANLYPVALSVGMLTDSRSFLSYPRHELYRRVLCNFLGKLVERGEYFSDEKELKKIIENVCYYNAKEYFGL